MLVFLYSSAYLRLQLFFPPHIVLNVIRMYCIRQGNQ